MKRTIAAVAGWNLASSLFSLLVAGGVFRRWRGA